MDEQLSRIEDKIDEILCILHDKANHAGWLSLKQATRYTSLSERSLRKAVKTGRLQVSKETGKNLFHKDWLDSFLSPKN